MNINNRAIANEHFNCQAINVINTVAGFCIANTIIMAAITIPKTKNVTISVAPFF